MTKPVSQETQRRVSRAHRSKHLTIEQERFIKAYDHLGNGTESRRQAGSKPAAHVVGQQSPSRTYKKPSRQSPR